MAIESIERRFAAIGARMRVARAPNGGPEIDVEMDRSGERFVLRVAGLRDLTVEVVHADTVDRALLLLVRDGGEKSRFLCGFDERHWFVAAIPESARGVASVEAAKDALQPAAVREAVARRRPKDRFRRRNAAYVRQGEWFFLPAWGLEVEPWELLRNEPLTRGFGKRHILEQAFRRGGETVYVNDAYPTGLTYGELIALPESERRRGFDEMVRDPELYAKGAVRHPDHATIVLHGWHRVLMNTEQEARAMRHVAFLD
jgi:hypothetical protein